MTTTINLGTMSDVALHQYREDVDIEAELTAQWLDDIRDLLDEACFGYDSSAVDYYTGRRGQVEADLDALVAQRTAIVAEQARRDPNPF